MTRPLQEIAGEIQQAVAVMIDTNMEVAAQMTGNPRSPERAKIGVRLSDGREVELSALADELVAAVANQAE